MSMDKYMGSQSAYLDQRAPEQRSYDAGAKSRDAEVAALKARVEELETAEAGYKESIRMLEWMYQTRNIPLRERPTFTVWSNQSGSAVP